MNDEDDGMILRNQARCKKCGDHILSAGRHDFVTCRCGNLSVDGGVDYLRRAVRDGWDTEEETSISIPRRVSKEEAASLLLAVIGLASLDGKWVLPAEAMMAMSLAAEGKPWFTPPTTVSETRALLWRAVEYGLAEETGPRFRTTKEVAPWRG